MAVYYGHVEEIEGPVDPGYGQGHPRPPVAGHPLPIPPLPPGIMPPIALPPVLNPPPDWEMPPIVIPQPPDKPLPGPPAVIWPPLPPGTGIAGKALILVWVVGVGTRWIVVDGPDMWPPPPEAGPKRG